MPGGEPEPCGHDGGKRPEDSVIRAQDSAAYDGTSNIYTYISYFLLPHKVQNSDNLSRNNWLNVELFINFLF